MAIPGDRHCVGSGEFVEQLDLLNLDVGTIVDIRGDQATLRTARAAAKGGGSKE